MQIDKILGKAKLLGKKALEKKQKIYTVANNLKDATMEEIKTSNYALRQVWDSQTLTGLMNGSIYVSDEVIKKALAKASIDNQFEDRYIQNVTIQNFVDKIQIDVVTKQWGIIRFFCKINELRHDTTGSVLTVLLLDKQLVDKLWLSRAFAWLPLGMFSTLFGSLNREGILVEQQGDIITVDFAKCLRKSKVGQTQFLGKSLLDVLKLRSLHHTDGGVHIQTNLHLPERIVREVEVLRNRDVKG